LHQSPGISVAVRKKWVCLGVAELGGYVARVAVSSSHPNLNSEMHLMFRKFFAVVIASMLVVGGLFAEEVKGVFKKFADGKVTVEVDGKATDYKVSTDAKVKVGKDNKEMLLTEIFGKWKEDTKGTFTVEKGEVTSAKKDKKGK
jgi:hypothetical protein